ncbi:hypothetical protein Emtol_3972 [Emticicia oligotrophica DSM 17448]|uniref:Immunity protein 63 domain-containing protein n=1 Tax=Emticicia oligotrophica (strain DSM 17448 / CIP 109782 / MTCC 6937 / GPTSA100-15) TaxID=929562 RepID=A0ABM5N6G0_EMTOG|nr:MULTISPECIES: hypothetical protein [Emticicia]AFK05097.1 hypothetical protein Emtol_3972 [Emticicia oligotrophica DSM 17448]
MNIQPTLRIVSDDVAIIDCLVDHGEMFKSFDTNKTATFLVGQDLHVAFYFSDSQLENRFLMYIIDDFTDNQDCMALVLNHFDEQIRNNNHTYIMRQAKSKVLDMLYMTNTFRALFGKNKTEEANELYY